MPSPWKGEGVRIVKISDVKAYATSFPVPAAARVSLGIGQAVKRDAVVVKVTTDDGLIGWGESHHGRSPGAVAHHANTTLRQLIVGMDAADVVGVWARIYKMQLGSHGMGAATAIAMSGIDMALWDIRGKATGWPLYRLLGGAARPIPAYAGGVSLGYQEPAALVEEARGFVTQGYRALKLRVGDSPSRDLERVAAVRKAFGDDMVILTDANTGYTVADARRAMPGLDAHGVGWLEEPFPAHDHLSYAQAKSFGRLPLAAGENHYTRFEFSRVIEDKVAALAGTWKLPIHPHTSMTGLNMAACIHFLAAIDNSGYFEADVSRFNLFRDQLVSESFRVGPDGCVLPQEKPGLGVEVDEAFLTAHPVIEGPGYV